MRARTVVRGTSTRRAPRVRGPDPPDYSELRDYQREGVDALRANTRFLLCDEMRLGKTVQVLRALPRRARAIVVCPASVVGVWVRECERWRADLHAIAPGDLRAPREGEIVVVSWDSLPERPRFSSRLLLEDTSNVFLVGDEIHYAMTDSARRTRRWRVLRRQCGHCWGLSGTPMPGDPRQLWGVLTSVGVSSRVADSTEDFVEACGGRERWIRDQTGTLRRAGYVWGSVAPEIRDAVSRVMLRREARNLVDMPPRIYQDVPVAASEDVRGALDLAWKDLEDDQAPSYVTARRLLAESRASAALDFARSATIPLLVFSSHLAPVRAFEGMKSAGLLVGEQDVRERRRVVDRFQKGHVDVLAMTIGVGGVGLDLSRADGILFVDLPHTPGELDQAMARADRVGKTTPVAIWTMTSGHPTEVRVREILEEKRRLQRGMGLRTETGAALDA